MRIDDQTTLSGEYLTNLIIHLEDIAQPQPVPYGSKTDSGEHLEISQEMRGVALLAQSVLTAVRAAADRQGRMTKGEVIKVIDDYIGAHQKKSPNQLVAAGMDIGKGVIDAYFDESALLQTQNPREIEERLIRSSLVYLGDPRDPQTGETPQVRLGTAILHQRQCLKCCQEIAARMGVANPSQNFYTALLDRLNKMFAAAIDPPSVKLPPKGQVARLQLNKTPDSKIREALLMIAREQGFPEDLVDNGKGPGLG